jgi:squalene-associated FAD-dependent desaturase
MRLAIIGAGWSGLAAAVEAVAAGHQVTVFESGRTLGGRARALPVTLPDGQPALLDNGQHILIGAYTEALRLMRLVGVDPESAMLRMPLRMEFPDGRGLRLPDWPAPLDALAGIARARGWSVADKWSLLRCAIGWQLHGFTCPPDTTVAELCGGLTPRVMAELIDPLCVSALNMAPAQAGGQVFLRVLRDSMFGARGGSHLLLPRADLGSLFPQSASQWAVARGAEIRLGERVQACTAVCGLWMVQGDLYDKLVIATSAPDAGRLVRTVVPSLPAEVQQSALDWARTALALEHTAITTVYAWGEGVALPGPMLALRSGPDPGGHHPAQFVFDRGQLGGPAGLLAFVISASTGDRDTAQRLTLQQASAQLGLKLEPVQTVVEKRATFACTPGLHRPGMQIAPGLRACGDYVEGPYPATLEGAVRAGVAAIR